MRSFSYAVLFDSAESLFSKTRKSSGGKWEIDSEFIIFIFKLVQLNIGRGESIIKQCVRCKHGHLKAKHLEPLEEAKERWECSKEHKIDNPREIINCADFEERPSLKKP